MFRITRRTGRTLDPQPRIKVLRYMSQKIWNEVFLHTIRCLVRFIVLKPVKLVGCTVYESACAKLLAQLASECLVFQSKNIDSNGACR